MSAVSYVKLCLFLSLFTIAFGAKAQKVVRLAGTFRENAGNGGRAVYAPVDSVTGMVTDRQGNVYFSDALFNVVKKIDAATGIVSLYAGHVDGIGISLDSIPATQFDLMAPSGLAMAANGDLYIADTRHYSVCKVSAATGIANKVAGTGFPGDSGDGGPAIHALLYSPTSIAVNPRGDLYILDTYYNLVRKVDAATGIISTVAGNVNASAPGLGGPATAAGLYSATAIALDSAGNLYIAADGQILQVPFSTGILNVYNSGYFSTGSMIFDSIGNLYYTNSMYNNVGIIAAGSGALSTFAGHDSAGFSGDGGPADSAYLNMPCSLALDRNGNAYISDMGNKRIRKVSAGTSVINTVCGTGNANYGGDGGLATRALLGATCHLTIDSLGNIFISDNLNSVVRKIDVATGIIHTVAGTGMAGYSGDGRPAAAAMLNHPAGITTDSAGNVYIADEFNSVIRKIDISSGLIYTIAGDSTGYLHDSIPATTARFGYPYDVIFDKNNDLYIGSNLNVVSKVYHSTGLLRYYAGQLVNRGYSGDGGPALSAQIADPSSIAFDQSGNLFINDDGNNCIRKVTAGTGIISTFAGNRHGTALTDSIPASVAYLTSTAVALDGSGTLFLSDNNYMPVCKVNPATNLLSALIKSRTPGYSYTYFDTIDLDSSYVGATPGLHTDKKGNLYMASGGFVFKVLLECTPNVFVSASCDTLPRNRVDTFTANLSDQTLTPSYQWYKNGLAVGPNAATYIATGLNYNDTVWAVVSGISPCGSPAVILSNKIVFTPAVDTVWPGDADGNHVVDLYDLLAIGLAYDSSGPVRPDTSIVWQADAVNHWPRYFLSFWVPVDYEHADCNGDGIVNWRDTTAIHQNWGLTHQSLATGPDQLRSGLPALLPVSAADTLLAGDTLLVSFQLGSTVLPAAEIYGLAFTYNYDPSLAGAYAGFRTAGSWLGGSTDMLSMCRNDAATGRFDVSLTRTDHRTRSGSGTIATAKFVISAANHSGYYPWIAYISGVRAIDSLGNIIAINQGSDTVMLNLKPNGIEESGIPAVAIRPNPARNQIVISSDQPLTEVSLCNPAGQVLRSEADVQSLTIGMDLNGLSQGLYFVTVHGKYGVKTIKLQVE